MDENPDDALALAARILRTKYRIVGFQDELSAFVERLKRTAYLTRPFLNVEENRTKARVAVRDILDAARSAIVETNAVDVRLYALLKDGQGDRSS